DLVQELLDAPRRAEALTRLRQEDALDELDRDAERPARLAHTEEEDERRPVAALLLDEVDARAPFGRELRRGREEERTGRDRMAVVGVLAIVLRRGGHGRTRLSDGRGVVTAEGSPHERGPPGLDRPARHGLDPEARDARRSSLARGRARGALEGA